MNDWSEYLESVCHSYAKWWQIYTLSDVVEQEEEEEDTIPLLDLGLMVETIDPEDDDLEQGEQQQKIERLTVLEGLRKYAPEHVLLIGRPGSGKSTALARLLLETAQDALVNAADQIPVLVELRYYQTSILDLVQNFLLRHRMRLNQDEIQELLFSGRFFLLVDGLNELPSVEARREVRVFRQTYPQTAMIWTTRELVVI
ncbi:NACHT domain-containing protein [Acaryochloris sp. IP29b_bin.137]|uniref:NACHT domain-containing protein n=1 Tax=Acaryochloris sp. IP29b_bin.137 TaxID=2969217 RepID=UPI002611E8BB|nr:NACHT domain-containing protein [Acaryochloris sp. IP29b_bin.137]